MCGGIAVRWQTIPESLRATLGLPQRIGTEERVLHFHYRDPVPRLPAFYRSDIGLYLWGNRDDEISRLPRTGWCRIESVDAGKWNHLSPEPVEIPAIAGLEKGVWFAIEGALGGILVQNHVYMLTQPAAKVYQDLTHHDRMPVLRGSWHPLSEQ